MRGEVSSKISARLGVATSEFEKLLSKQRRERAGEPATASATATATAPRHDIAMLCLLALRDAAARKFLLEQNWREVLQQISGAELLARILDSELRPNDPVSL